MVGRVHEVIVDNFKSYEGRVHVGPFGKFTCVVGPNGAGKSNLMDAISFVLGVRAKHLRGDRLQELIHRKEGEQPGQVKRTASVELVYTDANVGGDRQGIVFRRVIQPAGEARYQVNGEGVSQAEYLKRLESINILSDARNFLVFQGDVAAAAHRHGKDLTTFFEQVSGSMTFRQDYERLAAEKADKEDIARHLYTRKRNAINEKKRLAQQKEEAERYRSLEDERRRAMVEFYLFRFHCLARQTEEAARSQGDIEGECRELEVHIVGKQDNLQAAEAAHVKAQRTCCTAEHAVTVARQRLEGQDPARVQVEGRLQMLQERLRESQLQAQRDEKRRQQLKAQDSAWREEQRSLESELEGLRERVQREPPLAPGRRDEFEQARQAAEQQAAVGTAQMHELDSRIRTTMASRARLLQEQRETTARCSELRRRIEDVEEAEGAAREVHERNASLVQARAQQLERLRKEGQGHSQEKRELQAERQSFQRDIQDITATERQISYEKRLSQISSDLLQLASGVHGRVVELCSPSQQRFRVAVNVALNGWMDAVVTDTADAARQCVKHLKERMLDPLTFLPLDKLRTPPPDQKLQEALRGDWPGLRPALACLSFGERYERVFRFLLGDVIIADTLEEGRRFIFEHLHPRGTSCRLVTLAGETISRDGNLSISAEAAREGATRFDFATLEKTRTRLEAIDRRLHEIDAQGSAGNADGLALEEETRRLDAQLHESGQTLQRCEGELGARREELCAAEATAAALCPGAEELEREELRLREERRRLEESIGQEVFVHFAQLSADMGVDDIRRIELDWRREQEALHAREREVLQQLDCVGHEIVVVEQSLQERNSKDVTHAVADCQAEIATLEAEQEQISQKSETLQGEVQKAKQELEECVDHEGKAKQAILECRLHLREQQQRLSETQRRLVGLRAQLVTLQDTRAELFRRSVLEDVEVPLTAGGLEALQEAAAVAEGSQANPAATPARTADLAIDFAALPDEKRAITGGTAAEQTEEEYRMEIRRLHGELERLRPNLKAIEQLARISQQADDATDDAAAARREIEDVEKRFEAVRTLRRERFMTCFHKVQEEICVVYKRLTGDSNGTGLEGGSAYLDLEDLEDPYNGGIKFTAIPPMKRFCDISLLSGGEKTLAAMALLFAMQAYQRPPFLVLDEIDAHLDPINVQALARYVEQSACQTIVISLKDRFFSRSEGLVGVSKDRHAQRSVVFTCDLTRFRQGQAAPIAAAAALQQPGGALVAAAPLPAAPASAVARAVGHDGDVEMDDGG